MVRRKIATVREVRELVYRFQLGKHVSYRLIEVSPIRISTYSEAKMKLSIPKHPLSRDPHSSAKEKSNYLW